MGKSKQSVVDGAEDSAYLLKKLLILELFKLGVPQADIGKKLRMQKATVNAFLQGIQRPD